MAQNKRFSYDDETGEVITYEVNDETGETYLDNRSPSLHYERQAEEPVIVPEIKYNKFPKQGYMCNTKAFQSLKANIIAGSNTLSHRLLLLPTTLMICPALFCSLLAILEVYLHIRCHKKNQLLKDPNLYYRSPFHVLSSVFCGVCRDMESASKVGILQDQRRIRYDYFRGLAI